MDTMHFILNSIALRKAKNVHNFGLSECNRVKKNFLRSKILNFCTYIHGHFIWVSVMDVWSKVKRKAVIRN